jgi:hypothetical protein
MKTFLGDDGAQSQAQPLERHPKQDPQQAPAKMR